MEYVAELGSSFLCCLVEYYLREVISGVIWHLEGGGCSEICGENTVENADGDKMNGFLISVLKVMGMFILGRFCDVRASLETPFPSLLKESFLSLAPNACTATV